MELTRKQQLIVISLPIIAFLFIIGIMLFISHQASPASPSSPTALPTPTIFSSNPTQSSPPKTNPPVPYTTGSIKKVVNEIVSPQPVSIADAQARNTILSIINTSPNQIYVAPTFSLQYVQPFNLFQAKITTTNVTQAKQDVNSWLLSQGLSQNGICRLPLSLYLDASVARQLQGTGYVFNPLPDGC